MGVQARSVHKRITVHKQGWAHVHVDSRACACKKACPLPAIVLRVQQEVRADDGHTRRDDSEDNKHEKHKAVHVVHFVPVGRVCVCVCVCVCVNTKVSARMRASLNVHLNEDKRAARGKP
jgi:hypothetical protein